MRKVSVQMYSKNRNKLQGSLYQMLGRMTDEGAQVIMEEAEITMRESLEEVPRKTGVLASIGGIKKLETMKTRISVRIGYGVNGDAYNPKKHMYASEYMMMVHENLEAQHTTGKAKFFEDPVNRAKIRILERLRQVGRRHIK